MLCGNGDVDVAVLLSVGAYPFLVMQYGGYHYERRRREPFAIVAAACFLPVVCAAEYAEAPGLLVAR